MSKRVYKTFKGIVEDFDNNLINKNIINSQRYYFKKKDDPRWKLYDRAYKELSKRPDGKRNIVFSVGINDADYKVSRTEKGDEVWVCPYYKIWQGMLKRCYSEKFQQRNPAYKDCYVCEEWLLFSNFRSWMERQDWEGKELDKDILTLSSNIYSKNTCTFIPKWLNIFLSDNPEGTYLKGVIYKKKTDDMLNELTKPFYARINDRLNNTRRFLGSFSTEKQAHKAWQLAKIGIIIAYSKIDYLQTPVRESLKVLAGRIKEDVNNERPTRKLL